MLQLPGTPDPPLSDQRNVFASKTLEKPATSDQMNTAGTKLPNEDTERSREGQGESLTWSTFFNDTTVHGVRFIFRETHILRR